MTIFYSHFVSLLFTGIATDVSTWDGVVVHPHERAYIKPEKKEESTDEQKMDTSADASKTE